MTADDFSLVSIDEFYQDIQTIRQPAGFDEPVSDDQWRDVGDRLAAIQPKFEWLIRLRLTEEDSEKFHDWGFVLDIFREYLLANPNSPRVARLTFGFD